MRLLDLSVEYLGVIQKDEQILHTSVRIDSAFVVVPNSNKPNLSDCVEFQFQFDLLSVEFALPNVIFVACPIVLID